MTSYIMPSSNEGRLLPPIVEILGQFENLLRTHAHTHAQKPFHYHIDGVTGHGHTPKLKKV